MSAREEAVDLVLESIKDMRKNNLYDYEASDFEAVCTELAAIRHLIIDWMEDGEGLPVDREAVIGAAFWTSDGPGTLLKAAALQHQRERAQVGGFFADGDDVPHLGLLAEWSQYHHLCKMVYLRNLEGKTWTEALEKTRAAAEDLARDTEPLADVWQRAHRESQRKAAVRFLRDTEHLA